MAIPLISLRSIPLVNPHAFCKGPFWYEYGGVYATPIPLCCSHPLPRPISVQQAVQQPFPGIFSDAFCWLLSHLFNLIFNTFLLVRYKLLFVTSIHLIVCLRFGAAYVYMHHVCALVPTEVRRGHGQLESWMLVNYNVGAWNWSGVLSKAASALNCCAISLSML